MSVDNDVAPDLGREASAEAPAGARERTKSSASSWTQGATTGETPAVVVDALRWAQEKQALDPVLLDVRGICGYADYLLVAAGRSTRQVRAVADAILRGMRQDGHRSLGAEGMDEARWVLLDFGDVVIHVFLEELRDFYDLEGLWAEAPRLEVEREAAGRIAD